jgi:CspA family cold shock protein
MCFHDYELCRIFHNFKSQQKQLIFMKNGTVKFFNTEKGFGFITEDNGGEIFVHTTGLIGKIRENDRVEYEVEQGKRGLNAVKVRAI